MLMYLRGALVVLQAMDDIVKIAILHKASSLYHQEVVLVHNSIIFI